MFHLLHLLPMKSIAVVSIAGFTIYHIFRRLSKSLIHYEANIQTCILIESIEEWDSQEERILSKFSAEQVIGLDCEWVVAKKKRNLLSLLQLATDSGFCVLLRLPNFPPGFIPLGLVDILGNKSILKVGVSVHDDAEKLLNDYGLIVRGLLDLRHLVWDNTELRNKGLSLKSLTSEILGIEIEKSQKLTCSNWDAQTLSEDQIRYAATDAIVAAKIFTTILNNSEERWFWSYDQTTNNNIEIFIDMPFKGDSSRNVTKKFTNTKTSSDSNAQNLYDMSRHKPMYDNCQLIAPDGELLCNCKRGKAEWYIEKGLGEKISNNPLIVRLKFEPTRRPRYDDVFYTNEIPNQCVVCGSKKNLNRKYVVPVEYRKYFPNLMKKSLSHDVVLLCCDCHKSSNFYDQSLRSELAVKCDAPFDSTKNWKKSTNADVIQVQAAANVLLTVGDKIPLQKQQELKEIIKNYFKISNVSEEVLHQARDFKNSAPDCHGLKVFQHFCNDGGLINLEKIWRQNFIDSMKPKFLPPLWSVDHNHRRLALFMVTRERCIDFDENILGLTQDMLDEFKYLKNEP